MDSISDLWIWQLLARFHPLVVHFPIGLLVVAFLLELLTLGGKRSELRAGIRWLVYIGAATGVVAVVFGLMLAYGGNYPASTLSYHKWGGIITVILTLFASWMLYRSETKGEPKALKMYRGTLGIAVLLLTFAGHLGASLTHGDDYITSVLPWNYNAPATGEYKELLTEVNNHREMGEVSQKHLNELNVSVRRIFTNKCYRCHDSDKSEGELKLNSKEAVMKGGENGPILEPGNPEESEIMRRIQLPGGHDEVMPQKGEALTKEEVSLIRTWIDLGAKWADKDVKVFPEAKLALSKPEIPRNKTEFDNPIDKFTDAYFKKNNIEWPEPVGDVTYIRRVYMDVIGLLPKPEEIQEFVADDSPNKRERLVHSLLNRKHQYAQHWLTFWNDLLRNDYTGTGFITGGREQITDWLYEALYKNKPYDVMVRELTNPNERSDGFIRGIEWRGAVNASQTTEMQAAQNISQSLLGVNLKCASCHDSFVSNLTLDDAYSFAAIFADSALAMQRCDVPTGDTATAGFLYKELGDIDENKSKEKRLEQLADFIASKENGRLYRTIVNRYWELLMGRGLVEPVDAMDNKPWSQELLDWLASDLRDNKYDLKYLLASILKSRTYQLPSVGMNVAEAKSDDYVFKGPLRKRMTAEQFADAVSQLAAPFYYSVAYDPYESPLAKAQWIWYDARENDRPSQPKPGMYYFRHNFDLKPGQKIKKAEMLVTVDDAFQLYLNGSKVAEGKDWRQVERMDVTKQLKSGKNLLAVEGENGGTVRNYSGILLNLRVTFENGETKEIRSNEQWKSTNKQVPPEWMAMEFDDSDWKASRSFGNSRESQWGQLLKFSHDTSGQLRFARASLVENDPFLKAMGRPTRANVVTNRQSEATLLQALELTNGEKLNEVMARGADHLLKEYGKAPERITEQLYFNAYGRMPNEKEKEAANKRLSPQPKKDEVQDLLWAVVMNPEFQLIN